MVRARGRVHRLPRRDESAVRLVAVPSTQVSAYAVEDSPPPGWPVTTISDGGIFVSTDGGATWRNDFARDQHVYDVTIDPRDPKILYACGFESSAWKSTDRGKTWRRLRGYNFKWGHRVIPDPNDRSKVYITTFGGSVWHGPADGDPNAPEDIETSVVGFGSAK